MKHLTNGISIEPIQIRTTNSQTYRLCNRKISVLPIIKEEDDPKEVKKRRCFALCLSVISLFIGLPLLSIPAFYLALYKKSENEMMIKKYNTSIGLSVAAILLMIFIAVIIGLVLGVGIHNSYNSAGYSSPGSTCRGHSCLSRGNFDDNDVDTNVDGAGWIGGNNGKRAG